jgi:CheY-like chemotaxis protein
MQKPPQLDEPVLDTGDSDRNAGEIVVLNRDLFFGVKIGNTLRSLGYQVAFVRETPALVERLTNGDALPVLGIIDMNVGVDWSAVGAVTGERGRGVPVLVFGSHLDVEGRRAAKAAGVTRVLSNGDFHRDMVALVQRYARPVELG